MKLGLINSAWAQAGRDTAYGIQQTKEIGFDSIDVFADPLDAASEAAWASGITFVAAAGNSGADGVTPPKKPAN